jgi:hypothetical protein
VENTLNAIHEKYLAENYRRLDQAVWDYIRDRMISPSECKLLQRQGEFWPYAIVAAGYPPATLPAYAPFILTKTAE